MRTFLLLILGFLFLTGCGGTRSANPSQASVTTVYIVRHGEKDPTPNLPDPTLTPAGEQRAVALRELLESRPITAIFTTDTRRTRSTVAPLATALRLPPIVYSARNQRGLAEQIRQEYAGKTVVVVGHSNTILPLLDELQVTRPFQEIADSEYDYLFEVKLPRTGAPGTVAVQHYGAGAK
ncbi:histidine phosphatase family protein [Hymenobacter aerilatus]|uniref:Histidine phosphatase family protein n=1 Tax=Hymenobacter aerilatus TaxID=2932251 RepID=A0A8T9T1P3_9BACT|nr:phosphoglycerate mutase family protein [Hymenobacter aerilatus]UOR07094.1 histidine phosphatase family protein [Hymenobacter aerilatus]